MARRFLVQAGMLVVQQVTTGIGQRLGRQVLARVAELSPLVAELIGRAGAKPQPASDARPEWTPAPGPPAQASATPTVEDPLADADADAVMASIQELKGGGAWEARAAAARALGGSSAAEAQDALVAALDDATVEVAMAAASALGVCAWTGSRLALLAVLRDPRDYYHPLVRAAAVTALGKLEGLEDTTPLLEAVGDPAAEVSLAAIAALAQAQVQGADERLLGLLEEVSGFYLPLTRLAAARALLRLSKVDRVRAGRLHEHERDPEVREVLSAFARLSVV